MVSCLMGDSDRVPSGNGAVLPYIYLLRFQQSLTNVLF